jgi:aspartyl/asparaginyl-tRNA synthetase
VTRKAVQFVILRDESGAVQLVTKAVRELDADDADSASKLALTELIGTLNAGTFITVSGTLAHDERVKLGGLEVKISVSRSSRKQSQNHRSLMTPPSISVLTGVSLTFAVQRRTSSSAFRQFSNTRCAAGGSTTDSSNFTHRN